MSRIEEDVSDLRPCTSERKEVRGEGGGSDPEICYRRVLTSNFWDIVRGKTSRPQHPQPPSVDDQNDDQVTTVGNGMMMENRLQSTVCGKKSLDVCQGTLCALGTAETIHRESERNARVLSVILQPLPVPSSPASVPPHLAEQPVTPYQRRPMSRS